MASSWIGIGGVESTSLIQTGTIAATSGDTTTYTAWYELLPAGIVVLSEPINPGNVMEAEIAETSTDRWRIAIEDVTRGWLVTGTVTYTAGSAASAEWITERPVADTMLVPLADFSAVTFQDLAVSGSNLTNAYTTASYMVNTTGKIIAYPGPFLTGGTPENNFTTYYGTPLPTVTGLSPSQGPTSGGTEVTITGKYLVPGLVLTVRFGSVVANGTVNANGTITVPAPAQSAGTVSVKVTTTDGTSSPSDADQYTYVVPEPTPPKGTTHPVTRSTAGYDMVGSDGGVFVFPTGQSGGFFGSLPGLGVHVNNVVGMVPTTTDQGYFLVGSDGGVFAFGNAPFLGSLPGDHVTPTQPITGIVAADTDKGYFLVGRDGGVFAFGTVPFLGSLPGRGIHANNIIGIASTPSGNGYWLVSATGTVYGFGAAQGLGTAKGTSSPVSAIAGTPTGGGYWITTQNGSVYPFGNAKKPTPGTLPALHVTPAHPVIGIVHTADTGGYWLIGSDGGIFAFGDAGFVGSLPGVTVHVTDVVGAVPTIS